MTLFKRFNLNPQHIFTNMSTLSLYKYGTGKDEKLLYFYNHQLYSADDLCIVRNINVSEVMQHAVQIFTVKDFLHKNSFESTHWHVSTFISTH
jgi:hypothetical protein